jgi:hypothetical protein
MKLIQFYTAGECKDDEVEGDDGFVSMSEYGMLYILTARVPYLWGVGHCCAWQVRVLGMVKSQFILM